MPPGYFRILHCASLKDIESSMPAFEALVNEFNKDQINEVKRGAVMKLKQIVVSIENSPNRFYTVINELSKGGVNLRALNLVDTGAFGQLRLLVSDVVKARQILMDLKIPAFVNEVVAAEIDDRPGSLADILLPLMEADVRVIFTYAFIGKSVGKAILIFHFSDNDKAIEILQKNGATILSADSFDIFEKDHNHSEGC